MNSIHHDEDVTTKDVTTEDVTTNCPEIQVEAPTNKDPTNKDPTNKDETSKCLETQDEKNVSDTKYETCKSPTQKVTTTEEQENKTMTIKDSTETKDLTTKHPSTKHMKTNKNKNIHGDACSLMKVDNKFDDKITENILGDEREHIINIFGIDALALNKSESSTSVFKSEDELKSVQLEVNLRLDDSSNPSGEGDESMDIDIYNDIDTTTMQGIFDLNENLSCESRGGGYDRSRKKESKNGTIKNDDSVMDLQSLDSTKSKIISSKHLTVESLSEEKVLESAQYTTKIISPTVEFDRQIGIKNKQDLKEETELSTERNLESEQCETMKYSFLEKQTDEHADFFGPSTLCVTDINHPANKVSPEMKKNLKTAQCKTVIDPSIEIKKKIVQVPIKDKHHSTPTDKAYIHDDNSIVQPKSQQKKAEQILSNESDQYNLPNENDQGYLLNEMNQDNLPNNGNQCNLPNERGQYNNDKRGNLPNETEVKINPTASTVEEKTKCQFFFHSIAGRLNTLQNKHRPSKLIPRLESRLLKSEVKKVTPFFETPGMKSDLSSSETESSPVKKITSVVHNNKQPVILRSHFEPNEPKALDELKSRHSDQQKLLDNSKPCDANKPKLLDDSKSHDTNEVNPLEDSYEAANTLLMLATSRPGSPGCDVEMNEYDLSVKDQLGSNLDTSNLRSKSNLKEENKPGSSRKPETFEKPPDNNFSVKEQLGSNLNSSNSRSKTNLKEENKPGSPRIPEKLNKPPDDDFSVTDQLGSNVDSSESKSKNDLKEKNKPSSPNIPKKTDDEDMEDDIYKDINVDSLHGVFDFDTDSQGNVICDVMGKRDVTDEQIQTPDVIEKSLQGFTHLLTKIQVTKTDLESTNITETFKDEISHLCKVEQSDKGDSKCQEKGEIMTSELETRDDITHLSSTNRKCDIKKKAEERLRTENPCKMEGGGHDLRQKLLKSREERRRKDSTNQDLKRECLSKKYNEPLSQQTLFLLNLFCYELLFFYLQSIQTTF